MSSGIDWGDLQSEEMTSTKKEIDWGDLSAEEAASETPVNIKFGKRSSEYQLPRMKRDIGLIGKSIGSTVAGIPGDLAAQATSALNWLAKKIPGGKPLADESEEENPFTSQRIKGAFEELFPSAKAQTEREKELEEEVGLATSLLTPIPLGKSKAVNPKHSTALYKAARRLGLTEKQLTPLLHGEKTTAILGRGAKKEKAAIKALEESREALSGVYQDLNARGSKLGHIDPNVESDLIQGLTDLRVRLSKTVQPSTEKGSAIKFLEDAANNLINKGATPEELMNFYQDINRTVNWNSIQGGKKYLAKAKEFVKEALVKTDPALAKDFELANHLFSKTARIQKLIGKDKIDAYINVGLGASAIGSLIMGNPAMAKKLALGLAGKKAFGKISTKLLTDPKWQNLANRAITSIKNGSAETAPKLIQIIKNKTKKEMPEEYSEIDWDQFEE